jgi:hypothetical protein
MVFAVTSCLSTTDTVQIPAGTKNAVAVRYTKSANNTVELTVTVEGDVEYAAIVGTLNYDASVLEYVSHSAIDCANVNNKEAGVLAFSQANSKNYTATQTLFKVTFKYTTATNTKVSFTFDSGNFTNDQLNDVEYSVFGTDIKLA